MNKRKIIEWLHLIEDSEIRKRAIENCANGESVADNIKEAIFGAFVWHSTPQGGRYWVDVHKSDIKLINENI